MRDPEMGNVLRPQRLEVHVQADLAASVHFRRLSFELRQFEFDWGFRVRYGNLDDRRQIYRDAVDSGQVGEPGTEA